MSGSAGAARAPHEFEVVMARLAEAERMLNASGAS